jgi:hypothetical protein
MKKAIIIVLFNLLLILIILALFEGSMYLLVRQPDILKHCPKGIRNSIGYLYSFGERKIIQFSPACARHDGELGYTLKPGSCVFAATEFSNRYEMNSRGLRDDERSLNRPEVIVVGDSYAMGWGVGQDETFSEILERKSGLNVLTAGVASYGTAREMMLLRRLDTHGLRFLVIQYCENDLDENREFFAQGNRLKTMTLAEYQHYTDLNERPKTYYPGKYLAMKLEKKWQEWSTPRAAGKGGAAGPEKDDVDLFIHAVMHGPVDLSKVQIIVLDAVGKNDFDRPFIGRLSERVKDKGYPPYIRNMVTVDITKILKKEDYYVLDDHWTKTGHEAIAAALWVVMKAGRQERN